MKMTQSFDFYVISIIAEDNINLMCVIKFRLEIPLKDPILYYNKNKIILKSFNICTNIKTSINHFWSIRTYSEYLRALQPWHGDLE